MLGVMLGVMLASLGSAERPPFMSAAQHEVVATITKAAAPASAAATPQVSGASFLALQRPYILNPSRATLQLLVALDDPALRATLSACCPQVATLSAPELLAAFEAEAAVAEITHNIQARTPADWRSHYCINCADAELNQLNNQPPNNMTDYLPNMYELALLNISSHFDLAMTWVGCQTIFESSIFGFKPFSKPWPVTSGHSSDQSWPANWAEGKLTSNQSVARDLEMFF